MFGKSRIFWSLPLCAMLFALCVGSSAFAQSSAWRVDKSSGDVWFTSAGAQPVALTTDAVLKPGDVVRTGQNGRVLLMHGAESILMSANSVITIGEQKEPGKTSILQGAGSILLDVEKRNVQHFEVATPYLAAVVKGTQFRVTVGEQNSRVDVLRGQVQVADYKSGQYALVDPNQSAQVSSQSAGVSLSGTGTFNPIQQGQAGRSPVNVIAMLSGAPAAASQEPKMQPIAPAVRTAERSWAPSEDSRNEGWASGLSSWTKNLFGGNGRKSRDDDLTLIVAFPLLVGASVAIGAAALRRRQKNKQDPR